jgi:ferredoxin--NADP+ reductase
MSTGTGLAPFMSIVRDPETYEKFEQVILVHGVREVKELAYHDYLLHELPQHEFLGEMVSRQLRYYPTVTREPFATRAASPTSSTSGKLSGDLGVPPLDPAHDRVMICGSPGLLRDLKAMLLERRFVEGNTTTPATS